MDTIAKLQAENERLREALKAVDALWSENALSFAEEMGWNSPVGRVWQKVRNAIAFEQLPHAKEG